MARINKSEVLQEMQEGLRLDTIREKIPDQLAEKILPVYNINPRPRIIQVEDTALNSFNKIITVPPGKRWTIRSIFLVITTTATVGTRRTRIDYRDENDNVLMRLPTTVDVLANEVIEQSFIVSGENRANSLDGTVLTILPHDITLIEGWDINIIDTVAVDIAADDIIVRMIVEEEDMNPQR